MIGTDMIISVDHINQLPGISNNGLGDNTGRVLIPRFQTLDSLSVLDPGVHTQNRNTMIPTKGNNGEPMAPAKRPLPGIIDFL